ncbi:MAG: hypothetical protein RBT06_05525 [Smithellaceae bacterium]|nr:hypothetical protein [Smithellaceae bacterium]
MLRKWWAKRKRERKEVEYKKWWRAYLRAVGEAADPRLAEVPRR